MYKKVILFVLTILVSASVYGKPKGKVWTTYESAKKEDPDFSIQGEYKSSDDKIAKIVAVQVVALGAGKFDAYILEGGLPGEGWDKSKKRVKIAGKLTEGVVTFSGKEISATIKDSKITVTQNDQSYTLTRIERKSPTLSKKAPEGAVVLFDGTSADGWKNGKMTDGLLLHGTTSKETFQSYHLHLEFMPPYRPFDRGQNRGNSGVYHQGRYETQVLDSFGLEGRINETGGIYSISAPRLNMCFPPLNWQTYDVDFTAAVFENGKKVKNGRITVRLNGVLIQDDVELTHSTTASPLKESAAPGPIYLQNHGNPVFYKNIWVIKK
jgi:hypothetical protein